MQKILVAALLVCQMCGCAVYEVPSGLGAASGGGGGTEQAGTTSSTSAGGGGASDLAGSAGMMPNDGADDGGLMEAHFSEAGSDAARDVIDFRIAFTLTTKTTKRAALVNQRSACTVGMFWDLRLAASTGHISTRDDGPHDVQGEGNIAVNDGLAHQIVFSRTAGTLTLQADSATMTSSGGWRPSSHSALSPRCGKARTSVTISTERSRSMER